MSSMGMYFGEFLVQLLLILLGDGVVANVVLKDLRIIRWIVITTAWGLAVAIAAYITGWVSGAHLNPALTIGFAAIGNISWSLVPGYIIAQLLGGFVGAVLVYLSYRDHFAATDDADAKWGYFVPHQLLEIKHPI